MAEDSDLEKTEAASPRRLDKAREEGQVARSRELGTFMLLAAGVSGLWVLGSGTYQGLRHIVDSAMAFDGRIVADPGVMVSQAVMRAGEALWLLLPIFGLLMVVAVLSSVMLGGLVFSAKAFAPKFSKLSPVAGIKRMFSMQTLAELIKAIAKAVLIGSVGGYIIWIHHDEMLTLMYAAPQEALARLVSVVALCSLMIVASLILIVILDVPWQLWQHLKKLRMSKEDVKKEHKETEGDPYIKSRIRQQQRAMARRRMMADVPRADVIITNPTHYAVALAYDDGSGGAPRVIAKGTDAVALRIREVAAQYRIPQLEAPPLARALHQHVDIGREIPAALYGAVAEVLAWVFQLRSGLTAGPLAVRRPEHVAVPDGMDPLAESGTRQGALS